MTEIIEVAREMGWEVHNDKIIHPVIGYIASDKDLYIIKRELMLAICEKMGWGILGIEGDGYCTVVMQDGLQLYDEHDYDWRIAGPADNIADLSVLTIHAYWEQMKEGK